VLNGEIVARGQGGSNTYMAGEDLWQKTSPFRYEAPDTAQVARQQIGAFGMLALWALASCALAFIATSRVRVS
jgi:hypothetical protein